MADREKVIKGLEVVRNAIVDGYIHEPDRAVNAITDALALLKEQETKQYNSHEVACIIADLFGDPCACNFNDIDTWLPYKCDFRETCCPNPVGVACWEQYLKHKEGR